VFVSVPQKQLRSVKFFAMVMEIPQAGTGESDCLSRTLSELQYIDVETLARGREHDERILDAIHRLVIQIRDELRRISELYVLESTDELQDHSDEIDRRIQLVVSITSVSALMQLTIFRDRGCREAMYIIRVE